VSCEFLPQSFTREPRGKLYRRPLKACIIALRATQRAWSTPFKASLGLRCELRVGNLPLDHFEDSLELVLDMRVLREARTRKAESTYRAGKF
jgi:hypothetical protein